MKIAQHDPKVSSRKSAALVETQSSKKEKEK